jgi:CrcB protein
MGPLWLRLVALCAGGSLGTLARYGVTLAVNRRLGTAFPWSTAVINVSGSLVIGLLAGFLAKWHPHSGPRLLLMVGFLGAYTTFSTFSLDAVVLWRDGELGRALLYQFGSVTLGFAAAALGLALAGALGVPSR